MFRCQTDNNYRASQYDQIVSWMNDKYNSVIDDGDSIDHKKDHILKDKHNWTRLVPGSPRDPNFWGRVKALMKRILKYGEEEPIKKY